jgi:hypothetical protein
MVLRRRQGRRMRRQAFHLDLIIAGFPRLPVLARFWGNDRSKLLSGPDVANSSRQRRAISSHGRGVRSETGSRSHGWKCHTAALTPSGRKAQTASTIKFKASDCVHSPAAARPAIIVSGLSFRRASKSKILSPRGRLLADRSPFTFRDHGVFPHLAGTAPLQFQGRQILMTNGQQRA